MNALRGLYHFVWNLNGTKLLGAMTSIVSGFLAIPDLIAPTHVKYVAAANVVLGVMTANRGWVNTRNLANGPEGESKQ